MKRPGYLSDWEDDLKSYLAGKHPGWATSISKEFNWIDSRTYPQPLDICPVNYLAHPQHGCIPEEDVIAAKLKI